MAEQPLNALMERYAAGDDAAFSELYDAVAPRLYGFLQRQLRDRALAEDSCSRHSCTSIARAGATSGARTSCPGQDPIHPRLTRAALGAAAGAWGSWAMGLHCPYTEFGHVILGHLLPTGVLALVGLVAGQVFLAMHARASG